MNRGDYSGLDLEMVDHFIKSETDSQDAEKNNQSLSTAFDKLPKRKSLLCIRGSQWDFQMDSFR